MATEQDLSDLATEAMIKSIQPKATHPQHQAETPPKPVPADTQRWIASMSDCC